MIDPMITPTALVRVPLRVPTAYRTPPRAMNWVTFRTPVKVPPLTIEPTTGMFAKGLVCAALAGADYETALKAVNRMGTQ